MEHIKSIHTFNEGEDHELPKREELIQYIITNLESAPDNLLVSLADTLSGSLKKIKNKKLIFAFSLIEPERWNGMDPGRRSEWVLAHNPDLDRTLSGKNFLKMIVNNDWANAKSNLRNFLESKQITYIIGLSEMEDQMQNLPKGYVNKNTREELLTSIYQELSRSSIEDLKRIYQDLVTTPGIKSIKSTIDNYIEKIKEIPEDEWNGMTQMSRYSLLARYCPVKINFEVKSLLKIVSLSNYNGINKLEDLILFNAEQN